MRTSNYRKFKITKKQAKLVGGAAAVAVRSFVNVSSYQLSKYSSEIKSATASFCSCLSPSDNRLCIIIFMPLHAIIQLKKQYFNKQYCFTHLVSKILYFYKLY